jgi:hypothetical protein
VLNLQEYISELDHCSAVLANLKSDPAELHGLRVSLPANWAVKVGDQKFSVSTDWLADGVARIESNPRAKSDILGQMQEKLAAYRKAAQALDTGSPSNVEQSRAKLNEIFAAREFLAVQPPSWLEVQRARFYAWIGRQIDRLLGRIGLPRSIGNVIAWIVIALCALRSAPDRARKWIFEAQRHWAGIGTTGRARPVRPRHAVTTAPRYTLRIGRP